MPIIKENVVPGSTVVTDGWAAYNGLSEQGYTHYVVEHKTSFTCQCRDEQTGENVTIHTNRIEGAWKHAKDYFRHMNGTKVTQFEGHLCEIMWRWWDRRPKPEAILKLITEYYPLTGPPIFTAGYPVFSSWTGGATVSPDDTMSRYMSSADEHSDTETQPAGPSSSHEDCSVQTGTEAQPEPSTSYAECDVSAEVQSVEPAIASAYHKTSRLSLLKNRPRVSSRMLSRAYIRWNVS